MTDAIIICEPKNTLKKRAIPPYFFDVNGKTLLERILDKLSELDLRKISIYTSQTGPELISLCNSRLSKHDLFQKIKVFTVSKAFGTAEAVAYIDKRNQNSEDTVILYGNSIFDTSLNDLALQRFDSDTTLVGGYKLPVTKGHSNITLDRNGSILNFSPGNEAEGIVFAGLCWISERDKKILLDPANKLLEEDFFPKLISARCV